MQLFIIGNGFDLAHDLPTKYWDFRKYLYQTYPEFLDLFEEEYDIYSGINDEDQKSIFWNELEVNLANISEDIIIEDAVSIDLGLESGDLAIEETLYIYFRNKYDYIYLLAKYIKEWVKTIMVEDVPIKTSLINNNDDTLYINFNYTEVAEWKNKNKVIHIHGSLNETDNEPVLGHGNKDRIESIKQKIDDAEKNFSEKEISICRVIENYYEYTYKDISIYMPELNLLSNKDIDEIYVIGHSLASVDIPYFEKIDYLTGKTAKWNVHYCIDEEKGKMLDSLIGIDIDINRIEMLNSQMFFNL